METTIGWKIEKQFFFSLIVDESTDTGNLNDEIFLVLWCDIDSGDQLVHTNMNYFCVSRPNKVDGQGSFLLPYTGLEYKPLMLNNVKC